MRNVHFSVYFKFTWVNPPTKTKKQTKLKNKNNCGTTILRCNTLKNYERNIYDGMSKYFQYILPKFRNGFRKGSVLNMNFIYDWFYCFDSLTLKYVNAYVINIITKK